MSLFFLIDFEIFNFYFFQIFNFPVRKNYLITFFIPRYPVMIIMVELLKMSADLFHQKNQTFLFIGVEMKN